MKFIQESTPTYISWIEEQSLSGPFLAALVKDVLARGRPFRFQAGGSSMFPFVRDGDVISIVPLPKTGPRLGDVVAFCQPDNERLVIHRVVENTKGSFTLKGDSYLYGELDGPIFNKNLLGIVSRVERKGQRIRLGLGPERFVVAVLSRLNLLQPSVRVLAAIYRPFMKVRSTLSRSNLFHFFLHYLL